jgi:hypothetical protein
MAYISRINRHLSHLQEVRDTFISTIDTLFPGCTHHKPYDYCDFEGDESVMLQVDPEGGIDLIARFTTTDGQNIRLSWCLPPNADPYYHANLYESVTPHGAFRDLIGEAEGATEEELCDALERFVPCKVQEVKF